MTGGLHLNCWDVGWVTYVIPDSEGCWERELRLGSGLTIMIIFTLERYQVERYYLIQALPSVTQGHTLFLQIEDAPIMTITDRQKMMPGKHFISSLISKSRFICPIGISLMAVPMHHGVIFILYNLTCSIEHIFLIPSVGQ